MCITVKNSCRSILVASLYFILPWDDTSYKVDNVEIDSRLSRAVTKLENRFFKDNQLYEAGFRAPVHVQAGQMVKITFLTRLRFNEKPTDTDVNLPCIGRKSFDNKYMEVKADSDSQSYEGYWYLLAGLKYKVFKC